LYKNHNYIIKIEGDLSYKPLYNLYNIKLIELKRYLDNTLINNYIKYFINLIKAPILFVSKKDGGL